MKAGCVRESNDISNKKNSVLGQNAVQCGESQTVRRDISPPSSEASKPSKKSAC
jgi:hypothetical protein